MVIPSDRRGGSKDNPPHLMRKNSTIIHITAFIISIIVLASCGRESGGPGPTGPKTAASGSHLSMKLNGADWIGDSALFGAFHPPGYNKALLIGGSKGPKNKDEQVFSLNLFNIDGPGTYHIQTGNADLSVAQLANLTPENFMYGSLMGFDFTVTVTKAAKDPAVIEATFEGTLTGNASDTLKVTAGRFSYRE